MVAQFDLIVGRSTAHVLETLQAQPDARVVAGATDLIPFVRSGRLRPRLVVDITRLDDLRAIRHVEGGLEVGALVTHAQLVASPLIRQHAAVLSEAAGYVAGPQVRARGTLGGNVCTASPAADTIPALLVLEAQVRLISAAGERRLLLTNFFAGPGRTALGDGELLHSVYIPEQPEGAGASFGKVGKRQALVISVVNGAALLAAVEGRITEARIALGAVAPAVVRCAAAETCLVGQRQEGSRQTGDMRYAFEEAAELVRGAIRPIDDVRGSAAYRSAAAVGLVRRLLAQAWERSAR
jgi:CO/xanthine dehydrogenase FAD-binding subunit